MEIRNVRSVALVIAATDQRVEPGQTADVPDDLALSLLDQPDNWQAVKAKTPTKAAAGGTSKED